MWAERPSRAEARVDFASFMRGGILAALRIEFFAAREAPSSLSEICDLQWWYSAAREIALLCPNR
jgi:hypothetical protein